MVTLKQQWQQCLVEFTMYVEAKYVIATKYKAESVAKGVKLFSACLQGW